MRTFAFLFPLLLACGGKLEPSVDELNFAPTTKSAGYGAISPMRVTLVDPTTDDMRRTVTIVYAVEGGVFDLRSSGADLTLVEISNNSAHVYRAHEGTVTAGKNSTNGIPIHIDAFFEDPKNNRKIHLSGDYTVVLTHIG